RKSKYDSADYGKSKSKQKYLSIDAKLRPARYKLRGVCWISRAQRTDAPESNQHAECTADQSDDDTLCQQLANNAPTTCTERGSQGDLFLSTGCTRKHQICDVRTRNQQYKADRSHHHPQCGVVLAHRIGNEWKSSGAPTCIGFGILLFESRH